MRKCNKRGLRIDFLAVPDWVEIDHIEEIPKILTIRLVRKEGDAIPISKFDQAGPAFPELAGIFKNDVDGSQILFAIAKWRYYLPGVDAEGDYYEVHAYEAQKNENGALFFQKIRRYRTSMVLDWMEIRKVRWLNSNLKMPFQLKKI